MIAWRVAPHGKTGALARHYGAQLRNRVETRLK